MSRVGSNVIAIPDGVDIKVNGRNVAVKGKKGELNWDIPNEITMKNEDNVLSFSPKNETITSKSLWGLSRAMVNNMVVGVTEGFEKKLTLKGVGYRAAIKGKQIDLNLGFSHPVLVDIPEGVTAVVNENTEIVINGIDKQKVGQFAANIRAKRPVEPYKGKGIRYNDEHVIMKEGKKK